MNSEHVTFPTDLAAAIVRRKARTLAGKSGFGLSDIDDIQQELLSELVGRWCKYDPAKGPPGAFLATLAEHGLASILRYRSAKRRDYRRCGASLNTVITDSDGRGIELAQTLSSRRKQRAEAKAEGNTHRASDLRTDIDSVLAQLPPNLRALCKQLQVMSPRTIAAEQKRSRWSVQNQVQKIRAQFERAGLHHYLND